MAARIRPIGFAIRNLKAVLRTPTPLVAPAKGPGNICNCEPYAPIFIFCFLAASAFLSMVLLFLSSSLLTWMRRFLPFSLVRSSVFHSALNCLFDNSSFWSVPSCLFSVPVRATSVDWLSRYCVDNALV
ncbi:hypothetical protein ES705_32143 [subsurface metagenome]